MVVTPCSAHRGARHMEGVGVVVHAVHADHHRPGIARRVPFRKTQARAVETDDRVTLEMGAGKAQRRLARPLHHQWRAAGQHRGGDKDGEETHHRARSLAYAGRFASAADRPCPHAASCAFSWAISLANEGRAAIAAT